MASMAIGLAIPRRPRRARAGAILLLPPFDMGEIRAVQRELARPGVGLPGGGDLAPQEGSNGDLAAFLYLFLHLIANSQNKRLDICDSGRRNMVVTDHRATYVAPPNREFNAILKQ